MATKPMKPCLKPGCINLTKNRYCDEHLALMKRDRPQRERTNNDYDKNRPSSYKRGYDNKWRKYRTEFLKRNPRCKICGNPANVVDHIIPHKGNRGLFWTTFNHQALCTSCHSRKTAAEDGGFGNSIKDGWR